MWLDIVIMEVHALPTNWQPILYYSSLALLPEKVSSFRNHGEILICKLDITWYPLIATVNCIFWLSGCVRRVPLILNLHPKISQGPYMAWPFPYWLVAYSAEFPCHRTLTKLISSSGAFASRPPCMSLFHSFSSFWLLICYISLSCFHHSHI